MLLVTSGLDINIDELLSVNDRHAGFFACVALNSMRFTGALLSASVAAQ